MDLLAQSDLSLAECDVKPAQARFVFGAARGGRRETFERLGMLAEWLRVPVREWLAARAAFKPGSERHSTSEQRGHTIECVSGAQARNAFGVLCGEQAHRRAAAWVCPRDGRLYAHCCTGATQDLAKEQEPAERLSCCEAVKLHE
jgi:hypothetical protein